MNEKKEEEIILQVKVNRTLEDFELILIEQPRLERLALIQFLKAYIKNFEKDLELEIYEDYFNEEGEE